MLERRLSASRSGTTAFVAEVALHHHGAEHTQAALRWDLRAAQAAEHVGGVAEAADFYRRMLASWDDVRNAHQVVGFDRIELLTRLAQAEELAGDISSVRTHIEQAISLVDAVTDPVRAAMLQERRCWSLYIEGRPAASLEAAVAAVRLVLDSPPSLARVAVLAGLGRVQILIGHSRRAATAAAEAREAANQIEHPVAAALVAELDARAKSLSGDPSAVTAARQALWLVSRDSVCVTSSCSARAS